MASRSFLPHEAETELRIRIGQLFAGPAEIVEETPIKTRRVHRQVWRIGDGQRTFVLKRFEPERSCVERRAIERWLPALGMADAAPALFAVAAAADARSVWHVYEDLGDWTLDVDDRAERIPRDRGFLAAMATPLDWPRLAAALARLAQLHEASAGHALLGECRYWTGDLGGCYLHHGVRDAIAALEALKQLSPLHLRTRDHLLDALSRLEDEAAERCAELEAFGGPDCLLHGDFGVRNAMAAPSEDGWSARIIDWDHAGVGPASYDLSTLLLQIPQEQRAQALDAYCNLRRTPARTWPSIQTWNALFDTAERSRFANMAIWPALWAKDGERDSAFETLSAIASWFEALGPVLRCPADQALERAAHG